jgi:transposase
VAQRVRARRLTDEEGRQLQQIVRRGKHGSTRVRRALIVMASASGTTVPAIARLVAADEDTVRQVIHRFNEVGLACLDPRWAGGRPRRISPDDEAFIVQAARTRPEKLGRPFTHWSLRKLAAYLADNPARVVQVRRERLRQLLRHHKLSFQRTRTWKESTDPQRDAKLERIEEVTSGYPDRCFAFDQFGPLSIRPTHGSAWAREGHPVRLPATTGAPTASATSTAATRSATTSCGASCAAARAPTTPCRRCARSGRPAPTTSSSTWSWTTCRQTRPRPSAGGRATTRWSCASRRPAPPGPIRSRRSSGRSAASYWAPRTTQTTPCSLAGCRATCAGATPTPATRRPGRPTPRTRPRPQPATAALGPPPTAGGVTTPTVERVGSAHRDHSCGLVTCRQTSR